MNVRENPISKKIVLIPKKEVSNSSGNVRILRILPFFFKSQYEPELTWNKEWRKKLRLMNDREKEWIRRIKTNEW